MIESDNLTSTVASVFQRLTHSFEEDLQRISWIVRPTTDPSTSEGWIWPNDDHAKSTTFHSRLTHSYDPTVEDRVTFSTVSTSTALQITSQYVSPSEFSLKKFESTFTESTNEMTLTETTAEPMETVVDAPTVALADMSSILFDTTESSLPGLMFVLL
jgi:hypothetical protein